MTQERDITQLQKLRCNKRCEADRVQAPAINDPEAVRDAATRFKLPCRSMRQQPSSSPITTRLADRLRSVDRAAQQDVLNRWMVSSSPLLRLIELALLRVMTVDFAA